MKFAARTLLLAFASTALTQVVAITPAQAADCLIDTDGDGLADASGSVSAGTTETLACGSGASANGPQATAVGSTATSFSNATAVGYGASADEGGVAVGVSATATWDNSVAIGNNTSAYMSGVAIGTSTTLALSHN